MTSPTAEITVRPTIPGQGILSIRGRDYPCSTGKTVVSTAVKAEGDGATPTGTFPLRLVYFRPDVFPNGVTTPLATQALTPQDGWCDGPGEHYNQFIALPSDESHEKLWRPDYLYNLIVPLGYNDDPVVAGKGSAIFMHVAREGYTPTAGCIGLAQTDLLAVLAHCTPQTVITIQTAE
jgi:L,D-peptidoglycan transpeptidase YkuD (ErfK/YbiS/YcfS/YnhG family)